MLNTIVFTAMVCAAVLSVRREKNSPCPYEASPKPERNADWDEIRRRNEIRPVILEFMKYLRSEHDKHGSPMISYWDFSGAGISGIEFRMLGGASSDIFHGTLTFAGDKSLPRVEKLEYVDEDGKVSSIMGIQPRTFSVEQVLRSLRVDKQDKDKLAYMGAMASEAIRKGESIFSIVEYEKMKPEDFDAICGEEEIEAYCRLLEEEDFMAEHLDGPYIRLVPSNDPLQKHQRGEGCAFPTHSLEILRFCRKIYRSLVTVFLAI